MVAATSSADGARLAGAGGGELLLPLAALSRAAPPITPSATLAHAGKPAAAGTAPTSAASCAISVKWNSLQGLVYWPHQATPCASSSTRSWRSPSSSTTKKFLIVTVRPSLSTSCRSLPTRSNRATCSGPIFSLTMPGLSSAMSPASTVVMLPSVLFTISIDMVSLGAGIGGVGRWFGVSRRGRGARGARLRGECGHVGAVPRGRRPPRGPESVALAVAGVAFVPGGSCRAKRPSPTAGAEAQARAGPTRAGTMG